MRIEASVLEAPPGRPREDDGGDTRFRSLMRAEDWESLPLPIRRRFSKRLANGATALYAGEVLETEVTAVLYGGVQSVSRLQADGSVEA